MQKVTVDWVGSMRDEGVDVDVFAPEGYRSPTVTCITLPEGVSGPGVVAAMRERSWVIGGGYSRMKETSIRIGHMGDHRVEDVHDLLDDLGSVLR
jgi:aspartate aminotransferase-like enzyme